MKRLESALVIGLILALGAGAAVGWAQQAPPSVRLDVSVSRKPPVQIPGPTPAQAERDADEGIARIKAREKDDAAIREALRSSAPMRDPGHNYDVVNGIQTRSIQDALRRR
jgi:hypothetical protein